MQREKPEQVYELIKALFINQTKRYYKDTVKEIQNQSLDTTLLPYEMIDHYYNARLPNNSGISPYVTPQEIQNSALNKKPKHPLF